MNDSTYSLLTTIPSRVMHINSFDPHNSPVMGAAILPLRIIPFHAQMWELRPIDMTLDSSVLPHTLVTHIVTFPNP